MASPPKLDQVEPEPTNTLLPPTPQIPIGERCSPEGKWSYIDDAYLEFSTSRSNDGDVIAGLTDWTTDMAAELTVACGPAAVETTDQDQLANLLGKLKSGGFVIYVRHTHTDRSRGDTDVSLGQCDQQRILSDRGRDEALFIRNAYQKLDLPVSRLVSTQYCRTLETAILAFGVPEVVLRSDLSDTLVDYLATAPEPGTNTIIVAHIGTIRNAIGLDDTFEEGDSLVYRPDGSGGFDYIGRIGLYDWPLLAKIAKGK